MSSNGCRDEVIKEDGGEEENSRGIGNCGEIEERRVTGDNRLVYIVCRESSMSFFIYIFRGYNIDHTNISIKTKYLETDPLATIMLKHGVRRAFGTVFARLIIRRFAGHKAPMYPRECSQRKMKR